MPSIAAISLGSNLGNRQAYLQRALDGLRLLGDVERLSALYQTVPVGCSADTPAFLNAVVKLQTNLSATALHQGLQMLEQSLGRAAVREKNSPRTVDLDLLLWNAEQISTAALTVPHPRLHLRRFVLQPLAEVWPEAWHPTLLRSVQDLWKDFQSDEPLLQPAQW
jgi:2-amino-4-hydroxy-6-hydroxymethyldihydropteridine diphosphokinase